MQLMSSVFQLFEEPSFISSSIVLPSKRIHFISLSNEDELPSAVLMTISLSGRANAEMLKKSTRSSGFFIMVFLDRFLYTGCFTFDEILVLWFNTYIKLL